MDLADILDLIDDYKMHYVLRDCPLPSDPTNVAIVACLNDLMQDIIKAWRDQCDDIYAADSRRFDLFVERVKKAKERGVNIDFDFVMNCIDEMVKYYLFLESEHGSDPAVTASLNCLDEFRESFIIMWYNKLRDDMIDRYCRKEGK